jgi:YHS domain-containing protein
MNLFKKLIVAAIALVSLAGVSVAHAECASCAKQPTSEACKSCQAEATAEDTPYTLTVGLSGYSPVSYLDHNRAEPGSPRFTAVYKGVTYFFTSTEQIKSFTASPERYMPAYGGYCAFGCTVQSHFVPDPMSFKIIDGKTHLFLKNEEVDARSLWEQGNKDELKDKADAYWRDQNKPKSE